MNQALTLQALPCTRLDQQVDAVLLEKPGADACLHVVARTLLQDDRVDTLPVQKLGQEQTRRPGTNDGNLGTRHQPSLRSARSGSMDEASRNMYFSSMLPRRTTPSRSARGGEIPAFFLYGEPPRTPDSRTAHVETIAARSALLDWKIRAHRHRDLYQLLFMQRGKVAVSLDAQRLSLQAPAVVIMPPGCVHAFDFQRDSAGLVVSFGVDLHRVMSRDAQGLARFLETPAALPLDPSVRRETDLDALAAMLLREFSRSAPGRDLAVSGLLGALLANLQRLAGHQQQGQSAPRTRELELVARFRHQVGRRYREHTDIATYARQLGTSETRLRRACLAAAGESPIGIVHRRLLVEAERQLRYTSMSVSQVAWYLGFKDPAYFSRFFTRARGASPRAFRSGRHHP